MEPRVVACHNKYYIINFGASALIQVQCQKGGYPANEFRKGLNSFSSLLGSIWMLVKTDLAFVH